MCLRGLWLRRLLWTVNGDDHCRLSLFSFVSRAPRKQMVQMAPLSCLLPVSNGTWADELCSNKISISKLGVPANTDWPLWNGYGCVYCVSVSIMRWSVCWMFFYCELWSGLSSAGRGFGPTTTSALVASRASDLHADDQLVRRYRGSNSFLAAAKAVLISCSCRQCLFHYQNTLFIRHGELNSRSYWHSKNAIKVLRKFMNFLLKQPYELCRTMWNNTYIYTAAGTYIRLLQTISEISFIWQPKCLLSLLCSLSLHLIHTCQRR